MNKQNGEPPTSFTEVLQEWAEYFKVLLNTNSTTNSDEIPPPEPNLNIDTENFTLEEVSKTVKSIKSGKSPGNDHNVTTEALKHGGDQFIEYLRQIFNIVLNHEEASTQWKKAMSIAAKVFNCVILNRNKNKSCTEQIHMEIRKIDRVRNEEVLQRVQRSNLGKLMY